VEIDISFSTAKEALSVDSATRQDNDGYIKSEVRGRSITAHAEAESVPSLLHTLDDYLGCVSVAERIICRQGIEGADPANRKG
jgi:hypothetical protein